MVTNSSSYDFFFCTANFMLLLRNLINHNTRIDKLWANFFHLYSLQWLFLIILPYLMNTSFKCRRNLCFLSFMKTALRRKLFLFKAIPGWTFFPNPIKNKVILKKICVGNSFLYMSQSKKYKPYYAIKLLISLIKMCRKQSFVMEKFLFEQNVCKMHYVRQH